MLRSNSIVSFLKSLLTPRKIAGALAAVTFAVSGWVYSLASAEYRVFKETLQQHDQRIAAAEGTDRTRDAVDVQYKIHVKSTLDELKRGQERQDDKLTKIYELLVRQSARSE